MDNLLESNERTLVLFDSVCAGLSECLALVHADIKQMTEHRNKLAQIEQENLQAKLLPAQELVVVTANNNNVCHSNKHEVHTKSRRKYQNGSSNNHNRTDDGTPEDDPHHLAGLKLLDKRLADSFSRALSLNDLQKSSIAAKQQANQNRPSIFQVLLGKTTGKQWKNHNNNNNHNEVDKDGAHSPVAESNKIDAQMVIDDINRQTRLAMQYSKQLESHLLKVEDLKSRYEMHLKMGLVVKSVASAYLVKASNGMSGTLARRHCSSLVINDCSSPYNNTATTRSSLSSLNLSTWSSSRSKAHKRRSQALSATRYHNNQPKLSSFEQQQQQLLLQSTGCSLKHSNNNNNNNDYATTTTYATDWTSPINDPTNITTTYSNLSATNNETLSKSSVNIRASRSSLKVSKTKNHNDSQSSSKTTIKEFIENINKIESEFESFMGSFLLAIEDIQGFARVCQGDVFEITIKYGDTQKFKTKISVLKDNRQKCDNRQTVFKARIADVLAIKANECKGLGKRLLLGNKLCETRDLFTARSQLMTISLNQTGSIKLNLIVTWNPLHLAPNSSSALPGVDISHISLPPTPISSSTLSSLSSTNPSLNGTTTTINVQSRHRNKVFNNSSPSIPIEQHVVHNDSMYQTVDPTYGYYIPPPDYLVNEQKYN